MLQEGGAGVAPTRHPTSRYTTSDIHIRRLSGIVWLARQGVLQGGLQPRRDDGSIAMADHRWWRGTRGEWYVVAQFALGALVIFGPRSWGTAWLPDTRAGYILSIALMTWGLTFSTVAGLRLGRNLTPLPRPKNDATLVDTGPFRLV